MFLESIRTEGLSIYTYVMGCGSEAAVIDPTRDTKAVMKRLRSKNVQLKYIFETHIHADFLSGARQLASVTGASVIVSGEAPGGESTHYGYPEARTCRHGDTFEIGRVRLEAIHTPGHTPEHMSYLLTDLNRSDEPLMLFTGDFIFVGSAGRPDLLGAGPARPLADALYNSLYEGRISELPDLVQIYPGHGSGSACGKSIGDVPTSTLGIERRFSEAFRFGDRKQDFVDYILSQQPAAPAYFSTMKKWNREGPAILHNTDLKSVPELDLNSFQKQILDSSSEYISGDVQVVDIRQPASFAGGHIPGSISIWYSPNLASWAGWFLNYDQPVYIIHDHPGELMEAVYQMRLVGFDNIPGSLENGFDSWLTSGAPIDHLDTIDSRQLDRLLADDNFTVIDVRTPEEYESGHINGAVHIEAGYLPRKLKDLDPAGRYAIICGGGYRASLAASILKINGFDNVRNVLGGMTAWEAYKSRATTVKPA